MKKLIVDPARQVVDWIEHGRVVHTQPVSTSKYGLGEVEGSHRTPRGHHHIAECIGAGEALGTIFKSRVPTGELWTPHTQTTEDLILTRILWLAGDEPHNANSQSRFIYFHGTNQEDQIGRPCSIGCIRLRNADMIQLFDWSHPGLPVLILG